MSGLDGLQLDPDGFVDMDQFPDDGTDLPEADLAVLRDTLHADPVDEPTDAEWDAMFDQVLASDDTGPFTVDDVEAAATDGVDADAGDDLFGAEAGEALADDAAASDDDAASDAAATSGDTDDLDLDGSTDVDVADLDLDGSAELDVAAADVDYDGGLDLSGADDGLDQAFAADAVEDVPADIANNDYEDLL